MPGNPVRGPIRLTADYGLGKLSGLRCDGRSIFLDLRRRNRDACFYAFDLLWLDGKDLRGLTFLERKSQLRQLVRGRAGFQDAEHVPSAGTDLYQVICREDRNVRGVAGAA